MEDSEEESNEIENNYLDEARQQTICPTNSFVFAQSKRILKQCGMFLCVSLLQSHVLSPNPSLLPPKIFPRHSTG